MTMSPNEFLKQALDPIGGFLHQQGALHMLFAYLPQLGAVHYTCDANTVDKVRALRDSARILNDEADRLERGQQSSLIIPPGVHFQ